MIDKIFVSITLFAGAVSAGGVQSELELGSPVPQAGHELKAVSGEALTLAGSKKENGLLVIFSCNTCPYVLDWQDRYNPIASMALENKVGMVVLNPNEGRRDGGDSFEDMKAHAEKYGYAFPYALDRDHVLADAFGATRTPHVFLFDKEGKLVYRGAIDDNRKAEKVSKSYLRRAIVQMVSGKAIAENSTRSVGCGIKRVEGESG